MMAPPTIVHPCPKCKRETRPHCPFKPCTWRVCGTCRIFGVGEHWIPTRVGV